MFRNDTKLIIFNFILLEFYNLLKFIKLDHTDYFDKKTLSDRLKVWLKELIRCSDGQPITPYIHIFVFHIAEFIDIYKNFNLFSMLSRLVRPDKL